MKYIIIAILLISLPSCITTLYPLGTTDTVVTDDRVTGTWSGKEGDMLIEATEKSELEEKIENKDSQDPKTYTISFKRNKQQYNMQASLVKIGDELFIDLRPENSYTMDYLPSYSIAKLQLSANKMTLLFADGAFIKEQITNGHLRIKHESDGLFGTFLITASSAELQQFVRKYADDARLFSSRNSITLTRKG